MGGTHLHTPQSVFQHTMSHHQNNNFQNPWLNMPQVPVMSMPWALPASQTPDLVHFTGQQTSCEPVCDRSFKNYKRKLETPDLVNMRPTKQLITEEKMAQHFKGLQISSEPINACEAGPSTTTINETTLNFKQSNTNLNLLSSLTESGNNEPRLVISDAIKKLHEEPIIPPSLLSSKLERPTMALMLWEPPSRHLQIFSEDTSSTGATNDDNNNNNNNSTNSASANIENNNNNNENIPNFYQTVDDPTLEPMDL